ncbi:hypothetical protein K1719_005117 [Acacia pycnantha]|nr:hypothetical protein K1719_005117 [Acacia pycnantha]
MALVKQTEEAASNKKLGLSKMDLQKVLKTSLSGVDKFIAAMYKKLQKNLTSEELLPSLWYECKASDHHHHLPPSTTTIESLPNHVLLEVLSKVGSSSMGKLYKLKSCSKKFNNLIEEDDYIYKHVKHAENSLHSMAPQAIRIFLPGPL